MYIFYDIHIFKSKATDLLLSLKNLFCVDFKITETWLFFFDKKHFIQLKLNKLKRVRLKG